MLDPAAEASWGIALRDRMVKARLEQGLTQVEVAKRMGISQPSLSQLEATSRFAGASSTRFALPALSESARPPCLGRTTEPTKRSRKSRA